MKLGKYVDKKRNQLKKSKTKTQNNFFSTQIPIENKNNKSPLFFQNPLINSIIMKEEKKRNFFLFFYLKLLVLIQNFLKKLLKMITIDHLICLLFFQLRMINLIFQLEIIFIKKKVIIVKHFLLEITHF